MAHSWRLTLDKQDCEMIHKDIAKLDFSVSTVRPSSTKECENSINNNNAKHTK